MGPRKHECVVFGINLGWKGDRPWVRLKRADGRADEEPEDHKRSQNEIDYYRQNWWVHSNVIHDDKRDTPPIRYESGFKEALSTMQRLKRAEDKKKQDTTPQPSSSSSSWQWQSNWWESDYEHSPQKWDYH